MPYHLKKHKLWNSKVRIIQQDSVLKFLIQKYGLKNWKKITSDLFKQVNVKRSTKQCRDRWLNYLRPGLMKSEPFTAEEEMKLSQLLDSFGTAWTKLCEFLPGRSENQLKNFINATVRRNIRRFNKFKKDDEKIKGHSLKLLECSEIKKILMTGKDVKSRDFRDFKLSDDALEFSRRVLKEDEEVENNCELVTELDRILVELLESTK